jgi:DNA-directed RNA polymerase specialized sigma24 family protein
VIDALRESGVVSRSGKRGKHELLDGDATEPARYEWGLERREAFDDLVRPLSSSQRAVIVGCYRDGRSLRDIASEIGLDPSTCSIIRKQSLEFLRYRLGAQQSA